MPLEKTTDLEESVLNGKELDLLHFVNTRVRLCGRSMASSNCRHCRQTQKILNVSGSCSDTLVSN